jgi:two-component system OmpR family response regulator
MRVLVVEDEIKMASLLRRGLIEDGYAVDVASTGEEACTLAVATDYDAVVLDVMLPGMSGFDVCHYLRKNGSWVLDTGADDYLTKPFSFAELLARLRALIRRGPGERPPIIEVGSLRLDPATHQAWRGNTELYLSTKEFSLLEIFMRRPGMVVSRFDLLEHAWDYGYENKSNVIDVYVRYLREKIDRPFGLDSIETVRGAGYRLRVDAPKKRETTRKRAPK